MPRTRRKETVMSTPTETVERLYASFAAGDLDRVLELLDPDVEWITPPPCRGRGARTTGATRS